MSHEDEPRPTATLDSGADHVLVARFQLKIVSGPDAGSRHVSRAERVVVGSHPSCDLVLSDPAVSRFHLELGVREGRVAIRDLDSRNGTTIDGVRIGEAFLTAPATIRIGKSELRFSPDPKPTRIDLAARDRYGRLVGGSQAMRALYTRLDAAARSEVTVLLEGESGVGKDLAAEAIHQASARASGPFVVVDCASLASTLLESELFGHERGAFTGAHTSRAGAFELAAGGTVFLDEIGELGLELQPKLLGAIERREVCRIGGGPIPLDVRVIAATNRNLRVEVNAHRFRPDLYYRLAVLPIRIPPLAERLDDVPLLVDAILADLRVAPHDAPRVRAAVLGAAHGQAWPGNVRELRNQVERAFTLPDSTIAPGFEHGTPVVDASVPLKTARESWIAWFERQYLQNLLRMHGGNVSAAARAAGMDRVHLHRLLSRAGLR